MKQVEIKQNLVSMGAPVTWNKYTFPLTNFENIPNFGNPILGLDVHLVNFSQVFMLAKLTL